MITYFLWKIQLCSIIWEFIRLKIIAKYYKKQECKRCLFWCICDLEEYDDLEDYDDLEEVIDKGD